MATMQKRVDVLTVYGSKKTKGEFGHKAYVNLWSEVDNVSLTLAEAKKFRAMLDKAIKEASK